MTVRNGASGGGENGANVSDERTPGDSRGTHDDQCEAFFVEGATAYTSCACWQRRDSQGTKDNTALLREAERYDWFHKGHHDRHE